jgi:hypothetical protein
MTAQHQIEESQLPDDEEDTNMDSDDIVAPKEKHIGR